MQKITISAAVAGVMMLAAPANAADLGRDHYASMKDTPDYVVPTTWAGSYVGGHLGAAWTDGSADLSSYGAVTRDTIEAAVINPKSSTHFDLSDTSFIGGVHAGHNWQAGAFVYGIEGDVSFSQDIDYLATIRGRLGVAANNWLFYGTGGVAFIGAGHDGTLSDGHVSVAFDTNDHQVGFVVGGGAEVKLSPNWSVGVEGLYYGFDGNTLTASGYDGRYKYDLTASDFSDIGVVRGRVSYHFNRGYEPLK